LITVAPAAPTEAAPAIVEFGPDPSVKLSENVAVTDWLVLRVIVHDVEVPPHAPPHCLKVAPLPGAAISVTEVPAA